MNTSPTSWILPRDRLNNPGSVCRFLLADIIVFLLFQRFSAIVLLVDDVFLVPLFYQHFYLFLQLLLVFCIVTMITMEEAIAITAPSISKFGIQAPRFCDGVPL